MSIVPWTARPMAAHQQPHLIHAAGSFSRPEPTVGRMSDIPPELTKPDRRLSTPFLTVGTPRLGNCSTPEAHIQTEPRPLPGGTVNTVTTLNIDGRLFLCHRGRQANRGDGT